MAGSWCRLAIALAIGAGFATTIPSCADNNSSIFIRQMQAAIAPECTVDNDPSALFVSSGLLDVGVGTTYIAKPLVGNQLLSRGDARQAKAEPNRVVIQGAEVRLLTPGGNERIAPFTTIASGTVDPTTSAEPAYGVTSIELVPASIGLQLRRELAQGGLGAVVSINAEIKVFGKTLGGTDVETGPFVFPLQICFGCTVTVPNDAVDPALGGPNCKKPAASSGGAQGRTTCNIGQDYATDCRICQGAIPLCTPCAGDPDCNFMRSTTDPTKPAVCNTSTRFCE
jgi:hypothetical protein